MKKDLRQLVMKYSDSQINESQSEAWRDVYSDMKRDMEERGKLDTKLLKQIENDYNKLVSNIKKIKDMDLYVFASSAEIVGEDLNIEYCVTSDFEEDWDDVSDADAKKLHAKMIKLLIPAGKSVSKEYFSVDSPGTEEDWVGVWFTYKH